MQCRHFYCYASCRCLKCRYGEGRGTVPNVPLLNLQSCIFVTDRSSLFLLAIKMRQTMLANSRLGW